MEIILTPFVQRVVRQVHVGLAHVPWRRRLIRDRAESRETFARYVDLEWIEAGYDDVDAQVELRYTRIGSVKSDQNTYLIGQSGPTS